MRCHYWRGIVLSGVSPAVVSTNEAVDGLRHRYCLRTLIPRPLPDITVETLQPHICILAILSNTLYLGSYTHCLVAFLPYYKIGISQSNLLKKTTDGPITLRPLKTIMYHA